MFSKKLFSAVAVCAAIILSTTVALAQYQSDQTGTNYGGNVSMIIGADGKPYVALGGYFQKAKYEQRTNVPLGYGYGVPYGYGYQSPYYGVDGPRIRSYIPPVYSSIPPMYLLPVVITTTNASETPVQEYRDGKQLWAITLDGCTDAVIVYMPKGIHDIRSWTGYHPVNVYPVTRGNWRLFNGLPVAQVMNWTHSGPTAPQCPEQWFDIR